MIGFLQSANKFPFFPHFFFLEEKFTRIKSYSCAFYHIYLIPWLVFDACLMSPTVTRVTGSFLLWLPLLRSPVFWGKGFGRLLTAQFPVTNSCGVLFVLKPNTRAFWPRRLASRGAWSVSEGRCANATSPPLTRERAGSRATATEPGGRSPRSP